MSLMGSDLAAYSGDGLLLYDTATSFEWLSLGLTLGHSCQDVKIMRYVTQQRFRFATPAEVGALWSHAGIVDMGGPTPTPAPGTPIGVDLLLRMLGGSTVLVTSTPETVEFSKGFVPESATFSPNSPVQTWELHLNRTDPNKSYGDSGGGSANASTRDPSTGVYLVRSRT